MDELAEQAVDAINDISGSHEGHRAAHAKGTLLVGTFTPSGSGLTTAAHMQDEPVRVTARVSNGGGAPASPTRRRGSPTSQRSAPGSRRIPRRAPRSRRP